MWIINIMNCDLSSTSVIAHHIKDDSAYAYDCHATADTERNSEVCQRQQTERKDLALEVPSHKDLARSHPPRGWARLRTWQKRARTVLWCRRQRPANGRLHGVAQPKRVTLHCLVRLLINKMTQSAHQVEQEHDTSSKTDNGFATIRTQTQVSGYFPHKTPQLQN